jgi:hypothetical protein
LHFWLSSQLSFLPWTGAALESSLARLQQELEDQIKLDIRDELWERALERR